MTPISSFFKKTLFYGSYSSNVKIIGFLLKSNSEDISQEVFVSTLGPG